MMAELLRDRLMNALTLLRVRITAGSGQVAAASAFSFLDYEEFIGAKKHLVIPSP
jgi:hypothetical protein